MWRLPDTKEQEIVCAGVESGAVAFGTLKLLGEKKKEDKQ